MHSAGRHTSVDLPAVERHPLADRARQRLRTIRERLAELEARRVELTVSRPLDLTIDELASVRHARLAAEAAVKHAAAARRTVAKAYLNAARIHDHVADGYEVRASADPVHADRHRNRAARHRQAAAQDRLRAEQTPVPNDDIGLLPEQGSGSEGAIGGRWQPARPGPLVSSG